MNPDERLLEFLYTLPMGFVEFERDGTLGRMNPMVARTLMPHVRAEGFESAFTLLAPILPGLSEKLAARPGVDPTADLSDDMPFIDRGMQRFVLPNGELIVLEATVRSVLDHYIAMIVDITSESEAKHRVSEIIESTNAGTWEWNVQTGETFFNERWAEMLGYALGELQPISIGTWEALLHPGDRKETLERLQAHFDGRSRRFHATFRLRHKDGHWVWVSSSGRVARWTEDGNPEWMFGTHLDISDLKVQEQEASDAKTKLEIIAASTIVGVVALDADGRADYVSTQFTELFGYELADLEDLNAWVARAGADEAARVALGFAFQSRIARETAMFDLPQNREIKLRTKLGPLRTVLLSAAEREHLRVATFSNISEQKLHEEMAVHRSKHDPLTGLGNRNLFREKLDWSMKQARRANWQLGVCYLDLDGFKAINDSCGHEAGDEVLRVTARRLASSLRDVDITARLGGDEFAFVITEIKDRKECVPLLERILHEIRKPVHYKEHQLEVSCSIGVAFVAQDIALDADQMLRRADKAMYDAKLSGKNCFAVFDAALDDSLRELQSGLRDVRTALRKHELELWYQPIVDIRTGKVARAEALLRWRKRDGTVISPDSFLPAVYDHNFSRELGAWVVERAVADLDRLQKQGGSLPLAVNVFPKQLLSFEFMDSLRSALSAHPTVDPRSISLEIVETAALNDVSTAKRIISECRAMGIETALDDFGTGFSSLAHLRHLPVATLKIDKSFVSELLTSSDSAALVESTFSLARVLQRKVVAEGVESVEIGERLIALGCEYVQGYAVAKAMPLDELVAWTDRWRFPSAWLPKTSGVGEQDDPAVRGPIATGPGESSA